MSTVPRVENARLCEGRKGEEEPAAEFLHEYLGNGAHCWGTVGGAARLGLDSRLFCGLRPQSSQTGTWPSLCGGSGLSLGPRFLSSPQSQGWAECDTGLTLSMVLGNACGKTGEPARGRGHVVGCPHSGQSREHLEVGRDQLAMSKAKSWRGICLLVARRVL